MTTSVCKKSRHSSASCMPETRYHTHPAGWSASMEDRTVSLEYLSWSVSSTAYAIDSPFEFMRQACVPADLGSSPISKCHPPIVAWSPGSSVDRRGRPDRDNWDKYGIALCALVIPLCRCLAPNLRCSSEKSEATYV